MRIYIYLLGFLLLLFTSLNAIELTKIEKNYLKNKKIIKVHNEKNWPPYNFNDNGKPKGFSIDYTNLLAKKLGLKVEYISGYSWNEYLDMLKNKKIDIINNISKNDEREKYIDFTDVFHVAENAIYTNNNSKNIKNLNDLINKTIVMPKGFFAQQQIEKYYPNIKQIFVKDSLEALKQLSLGKADATVGKKNVLDYLISTKNISGVSPKNFLNDFRIVSKIRMGVPKGEKILLGLLQKAQKDVELEDLLILKRKWFGVNSDKKENNLFLNEEEHSYLTKKNVLNVCTNKSIRPIGFIEDNKYQGIIRDVFDLVNNILEIKTNFIITSSARESEEYLEQNKCDIITYLESKENLKLTFTKSYLKFKLAFITQKNESLVYGLESIQSKSMALNQHNKYEKDIITKYQNITPFYTNSILESLIAVNNNKAYFAVLPYPVASYYISKYALTDLHISKYTNTFFNVKMVIKDDNQLLLQIINKVIDHVENDGERKIIHNWSSIPIQEEFNYSRYWQFLLFVLVVFAVIFYRQILLSKHNKELQKANKLIEKKSKELEELTSSLEKRVEEEVVENVIKTNQLIQQSRLAQMGELINMIAHQWRQPITAISATTHNLLFKLQLGKIIEKDLLKEELNLINEYTHHLSDTIEDFRNFFMHDKDKESISVKELIDRSKKIVYPSLIDNGIQLIINHNCNILLYTYVSEVNQVILNLFKNAEEVLVEKKIKYPKITINTYSNDGNIIIEFIDNGGGIEENHLAAIFDAYYSTKKSKNGSGLGLYMSKTIIEDHCCGSLSASNNESGAVFTIVFSEKTNDL